MLKQCALDFIEQSSESDCCKEDLDHIIHVCTVLPQLLKDIYTACHAFVFKGETVQMLSREPESKRVDAHV